MVDRTHLFKVGRIWYGWVYELQTDGSRKQVKKSTRCTDVEAASRVRSQWERDAADPDTAKKRGAKLSDAVDLLVAETRSRAKAKNPTRSERTIDYQETAARPWYVFAALRSRDEEQKTDISDDSWKELAEEGKAFPLAQVEPDFVDSFIRWRRLCGVAEYTISKNRGVLRPALRMAKRKGIWAGDVEACFPRGFELEYTPRDRWAPVDEAWQILNKLPKRRAATLAYAFGCGAEPAAIWRARREDVSDLENQDTVRVRGTKNSRRDRHVPIITPDQRKFLTFAMKHASGEDGLLFETWANIPRDLAKACDDAKVEAFIPVDARRSYAHYMKDAGVRQEDLAVAMGHSSMAMLDRVYGRANKPAELVDRFRKAAAERTVALRLIKGAKRENSRKRTG